MVEFIDKNGCRVTLAFQREAFSLSARHVIVFCRFEEKWLLTLHPKRGLEFPGGKVEDGETIEEAARREVFEETGALVEELKFVGEYFVRRSKNPFVKAVFFAKIGKIERKDDYLETEGPVLFGENLLTERMNDCFSFLMQDEVVEKTLDVLKEKQWLK
ncbi:7,8-dihydro-8-oxoguanine-triphosphatase [Bacillus sp. FJAT-27231]|uniref:RNA deprotection pyrophosphohydrolase n=1 Tax=Bacillus sp. FJAT-27231 TaxID=1679168 RepID=UPI0006714FCD|nr:nucleoside triphosphatase YtkD [Bacillus sp. FJAT-27231]KMY55125.1 7,8-dihydro-8-oxoguanine-triphosphatase [Bacillus sp. FJAT-27231]